MSNDIRFDRLYIIKIKEGQKEELEQLCKDYRIPHNNVFDGAPSFHVIYGINQSGLIYLSNVMALRGIDFYSIDELREYLDEFENKN